MRLRTPRICRTERLPLVLVILGAVGCYAGVGVGEQAGAEGGGSAQGDSGGVEPEDDEPGEPAATACDGRSISGRPLRRLTRLEYDNTVRDLFGIEQTIAQQRFSPDPKTGGYAANDVALSVTALDEYARAAEDIAAIAVDRLPDWVSCELDELHCPRALLETLGLHVFRRPLAPEQVEEYLALFVDAESQWDRGTAYRMVLEAMLLSPKFLYHVEPWPAEAPEAEIVAVDDYVLASRLSYFLWASKPDAELFELAAQGALHDDATLAREVERMMNDPRAEQAIASFTNQWLHIDDLGDRSKDPELFPAWDQGLAAAMQRETAEFAHAVIAGADPRLDTLLTADWTIGNARLAGLYGADPPDAGWDRIALPPQERAGVLTQLGFLAGSAHAAEPSWVYRGMFVRENLLCQVVSAPPPNVDTAEANDLGRLERPECSGCHLLMDPIGWGFDQYDAIGAFSAIDDDGEAIDASGEVLASSIGAFSDPLALAHALAEAPEVSECYALQWLRFATRRQETQADECVVSDIQAQFSASGGDIRELIAAIAVSDAFRLQRAAVDPT